MKNLIFCLFLLIVFVSCDKKTIEPEAGNNPVFAALLKKSADTLGLNGNTFVLKAFVWRNLMPVVDPGNNGLLASCSLEELNRLPIPHSASLTKLYVIKGNIIWSTEFNDVNRLASHILKANAYFGPVWEPGASVDVVCEFSIYGQKHRIISRGISIGAVY
jgi:hypothetical protein